MPSLITQAKNVTIAFAKWVAAGRPLRPQEAREALFVICSSCPTNRFVRYTPDRGRCSACGCWLGTNPNEVDKLALLTEGCPDGHWQNEVEQEPINFDALEDD